MMVSVGVSDHLANMHLAQGVTFATEEYVPLQSDADGASTYLPDLPTLSMLAMAARWTTIANHSEKHTRS